MKEKKFREDIVDRKKMSDMKKFQRKEIDEPFWEFPQIMKQDEYNRIRNKSKIDKGIY